MADGSDRLSQPVRLGWLGYSFGIFPLILSLFSLSYHRHRYHHYHFETAVHFCSHLHHRDCFNPHRPHHLHHHCHRRKRWSWIARLSINEWAMLSRQEPIMYPAPSWSPPSPSSRSSSSSSSSRASSWKSESHESHLSLLTNSISIRPSSRITRREPLLTPGLAPTMLSSNINGFHVGNDHNPW